MAQAAAPVNAAISQPNERRTLFLATRGGDKVTRFRQCGQSTCAAEVGAGAENGFWQ
jgi:hypothetical protein